MNVYRIMFVCTGNICRSPLAHAVFQDLVDREGLSHKFLVESSGTGAWHVGDQADERMRRTSKKHGVLINHPARLFTPRDLDDYDLILVMDNHNMRSIRNQITDANQKTKIKLFREFDPHGGREVPDPWYGEQEGFEEVWEIVSRTSEALLNHLKRNMINDK